MKKKYAASVLAAVMLFFSFTAADAEGTRLVPVGRAVGIQLYTDGLTVIGTSEVNGTDCAKRCGIKVNDRITAIDGTALSDPSALSQAVNENPEGVSLEIIRDNRKFEVNAVPELSEDDVYRLGIWVRDSCAGIGTVTYYDPSSDCYAALGHAINDVDTGNILSAKSGSILSCQIVSVSKSKRGVPGEINASFGDEKLGDIAVNSPMGIFGKSARGAFDGCGEAVEVAAKEQVHSGDAYILSDIYGSHVEKYAVKIDKVTDDDDKGLVIEITDSRLIENTGGIVQGMSGSPIIQDGRLVGAVTHVFVNSPLKGYGTLAEKMLDTQMKSV